MNDIIKSVESVDIIGLWWELDKFDKSDIGWILWFVEKFFSNKYFGKFKPNFNTVDVDQFDLNLWSSLKSIEDVITLWLTYFNDKLWENLKNEVSKYKNSWWEMNAIINIPDDLLFYWLSWIDKNQLTKFPYNTNQTARRISVWELDKILS